VRSIELKPTCLPPEADEPAEPAGTAATGGAADTTPTTQGPAPTVEPLTLGELLASDPQFSAVANAVDAAGSLELVGEVEPFTAFAPSNDAFDALSPEIAGALNADPGLLDAVLQNHVTPGIHRLDDLESGSLPMVGGWTVLVDADSTPPTLTSGSTTGTVTDGDISIAEGVVHVIDRLLVPPDLDLGAVAGQAMMTATYEGGAVILDGVVSTSSERDQLVAAAQTELDPSNIIDQLEIDAGSGPDPGVAVVVDLLPRATTSLASGVVAVVEDGVELTGAAPTVAAADAITAAGTELGARADVRQRPQVGSGDLTGDAGAAAVEELQQMLDLIVDEDPIRFAPGSFELTGAQDAALDRLAAAIKGLGGTTVRVEGHTVDSGDETVDFLLSYARASATADELIARGVPSAQLEVVALGGSEPVLDGEVTNVAASHRVTFTVEAP
jgi:outer membrane protein OmpA-like peptidoglycan-associated protein/uncharacterized surface protein with fasciclin (FAS1) repeats